MSRPLAKLAAVVLASSAAAARAEAPPPQAAEPAGLASEVDAGFLAASLHGLALQGWALRVGLGRRLAPSEMGFLGGLGTSSVEVLFTGGLSRASTPAGLVARGWRLGAGLRQRWGRLFAGADAEVIWLDVPRVSTSGRLSGTGLGARLLGGADLVRLGPVALAASLEVTVDGYDIASPSFVAAVQLGAGLRF